MRRLPRARRQGRGLAELGSLSEAASALTGNQKTVTPSLRLRALFSRSALDSDAGFLHNENCNRLQEGSMPRIRQIRPGESPDRKANEILESAVTGWWADPGLFGLVAHRPNLLKAQIEVFTELFSNGTVEPYIKDMMRIRTGLEWQCAY